MTRTTIHSDYIPDNAITGTKIAENSITAREIATNAITTLYVADDSVTADKLANSINTDIATGVAALPKAGGTMTGNLGVGDTAVSSITGLFSTSTANHIAGQFVNSNASDSFGIVVKAGNDANDYTADFRDKDNNNHMRIRGDGKVGLGTSSPQAELDVRGNICLLYTSPSPRDGLLSRMPSSA